MPTHFADFITSETPPDVFIVQRRTELVIVLEELIMMWVASEAKDYISLILTIPL
jgi:hypothetical protein